MLNETLPEPFGVMYRPAPEFDETDPEDATRALMILEPAFNGVVFRFNTIKMEEDETHENALLHYDYTLINGKVSDDRKAEFEFLIGNLLYDILLESINTNQ